MYRCQSWAIKKAECQRNDAFELLEKTLESPLDCKEIKPVNPKWNQSWIFIERTDTEAETPILWPPDCEELTHLKRPWCWERLKAEGEGDDRGWDGWMASPTQWTWVWVNFGSCWWTGRPGVLQFMGNRTRLSNWSEHTLTGNWQLAISVIFLGPWWFYFFNLSQHLQIEKFYITNSDFCLLLKNY